MLCGFDGPYKTDPTSSSFSPFICIHVHLATTPKHISLFSLILPSHSLSELLSACRSRYVGAEADVYSHVCQKYGETPTLTKPKDATKQATLTAGPRGIIALRYVLPMEVSAIGLLNFLFLKFDACSKGVG